MPYWIIVGSRGVWFWSEATPPNPAPTKKPMTGLVVIGNMGGKLKTGRYVDYPGYGHKGHRTTANMYVTLLHLAGDKRDTFGMADPSLKDLDQHGPLAELLV